MAVNLVNVEAVSKVYGTRALLDGVSLGVSEGDRIGVVGRNGDGKTTLIRMLAKLEEPDTGRVTHSGGLRLGVLTQHDSLDPTATVRHEVIGDMADHEWAGNAKIRDVLTGLFGGLDLPGFPQGLDTVIGPLSGGERRRIALAKLLIDEQDLIVLDEPTNHLDVEGIAWLAGHLQRAPLRAGLRHPRPVVPRPGLHPDVGRAARRRATSTRAATRDYVFARAERERIAATEEVKRQNLVRKELAWLRRGAPARTSKPRFRIEAANELIADVPPPRDTSELMKFANVPARQDRLRAGGRDRPGRAQGAAQAPDLAARPRRPRSAWSASTAPARPRCCGPWPRPPAASGEQQPAAGRIVVGKTVKLAYLSQEVAELDPTWRVLQAVQQVRDRVDLGKGREMTAGQLCETVRLHQGEAVDAGRRPVAAVSGAGSRCCGC